MSSFLTRVLALVGLGAAAGMGHSWASKPFSLTYKPPERAASPAQPSEGVPGDSGRDREAAPAGTDAAAPAASDGSAAGALEPIGVKISLDQARKLYEDGTAIFVDARTRKEYQQGHITGAMHLEAAMLTHGSVPEKVRQNLFGTTVVIYCGGGDCDASENVAARLGEMKVDPIHIMDAGYQAWVDAGFEWDAGPDQFEGGGG